MAAKGKSWEHEVGQALRTSCAWRYNTNDFNPACDWLATYGGQTVLLEAKETHSDLLGFRAVSEREEQHLSAVCRAGGFAAVIIKRTFPTAGRAWVVNWDDFAELRETAGRASISLRDGQRPNCLIELSRKDRPNSLGRCWDLDPVLEPWLLRHCWRLIARFQQAGKVRVTGPMPEFTPARMGEYSESRPAPDRGARVVSKPTTGRSGPALRPGREDRPPTSTALVLNLFKPLGD